MSKQVLIISSEPYQYSESPLLGVFQKDQFEALKNEGVNVSVLSPAGRSLRYLFRNVKRRNKLTVDLNNVYRANYINFAPRIAAFERRMFIILGVLLFKKSIKNNGLPNIIHAHNARYAGELARIISKKWDIPYVVTEHSSWVLKKAYQGCDKHNIGLVFSDAKEVIAVGRKLAGVIQSEYHVSNICVVPNIVSEQFMLSVNDALSIKKSPPTNEFRLINVASLDDNKNQLGIIQAFAKFKKKVPHAKLILIGDGPSKSEIIRLINKLELTSCIQMCGALCRYKVVEQLLLAHIFVLGSFFETFGVVMIEANALGIPVLATPCGGENDIIINQFNGLVLKDHSEQAIYEGMLEIHAMYDQFDGKAIASETRRQYSAPVIAQQLDKIYNRVIAGNQ